MKARVRNSQLAVRITMGILIGSVVLIGIAIDIVLISLVPWGLIQ